MRRKGGPGSGRIVSLVARCMQALQTASAGAAWIEPEVIASIYDGGSEVIAAICLDGSPRVCSGRFAHQAGRAARRRRRPGRRRARAWGRRRCETTTAAARWPAVHQLIRAIVLEDSLCLLHGLWRTGVTG